MQVQAKIAKVLWKKGEGLELTGRRMHRLRTPSTSALPSLLSMYFLISNSPLWTSDNSSVVCNSGTFVPQSLNTIFLRPHRDRGIDNRFMRNDFADGGHVDNCVLMFKRRDELVRGIDVADAKEP